MRTCSASKTPAWAYISIRRCINPQLALFFPAQPILSDTWAGSRTYAYNPQCETEPAVNPKELPESPQSAADTISGLSPTCPQVHTQECCQMDHRRQEW